ncbi:MAG TPA: 5,6-dimethylbenzimidazole synthase [Acidimicrobiales bacterium]
MDAPTDLYQTIARRRDVRSEFTGGPADDETLLRILGAAHAAPSVGLSQPWDFVLVDEPETRTAFWEHVQGQRRDFATSLPPDRRALFEPIRIDGILDASVSIVVTYDPARGAPHVLGRHAIADAGLYSVCLAIENLWLAATAEGWGVGWVSFYEEDFLAGLLDLPDRLRPVAWLCVGPVTHHQATPDLERQRWAQRRPLSSVLHRNRWTDVADATTP